MSWISNVAISCPMSPCIYSRNTGRVSFVEYGLRHERRTEDMKRGVDNVRLMKLSRERFFSEILYPTFTNFIFLQRITIPVSSFASYFLHYFRCIAFSLFTF